MCDTRIYNVDRLVVLYKRTEKDGYEQYYIVQPVLSARVQEVINTEGFPKDWRCKRLCDNGRQLPKDCKLQGGGMGGSVMNGWVLRGANGRTLERKQQ